MSNLRSCLRIVVGLRAARKHRASVESNQFVYLTISLQLKFNFRDILSPARIDKATTNGSAARSMCPVCSISLDDMKTDEIELHIERHFAKSPVKKKAEPNLEKEAQKLREQREFEMLRAQYGMDDQGNFREQSSSQMQRAVYAGEMSVADYYERQVGLRAAESHGIGFNVMLNRNDYFI